MIYIKPYLSTLLFRYKLGAILDFRLRILELRNFVYYKLIELRAAQAPVLRERFHKSKIRNQKSQIMANDAIGVKRI